MVIQPDIHGRPTVKASIVFFTTETDIHAIIVSIRDQNALSHFFSPFFILGNQWHFDFMFQNCHCLYSHFISYMRVISKCKLKLGMSELLLDEFWMRPVFC